MKVNPAKDIIQINGKIIKKFIFIFDALLENKPKIKLLFFIHENREQY